MTQPLNDVSLSLLTEKARQIRKETLQIHKIAPSTRIASSLSCVEMLVALYYGKILDYRAADLAWEGRDRFIVSKGHGSISLYPILAECGYFPKTELTTVCQEGSFLGGIPDPLIPGYETVNGSLGHGLGVACGMALALKQKKQFQHVFVLMGDGELYEGSIWEAVMFAGQHHLDNLTLIVDNNKICMLGYCKDIIDLEPLENKFSSFQWDASRIDGHDLSAVMDALTKAKAQGGGKPRVIISDTVKGKGVPRLEIDPLNHVKNLSAEEIDILMETL